MRVLPSGTEGLLLEMDSVHEVLGRYAALREADLPVVDLVPAGRTILVVAERGVSLTDLAAAVRAVRPRDHVRDEAREVEVPVVYDGQDLEEAAGLLGLGAAELRRRHQDERWTVAFCGFAPGFGYLTGERYAWDVPRRATPRTRVPAGSVALAGEFTGVYPRESPGGWQLLGRALVEAFDLHRDPPALLVPGARVRFVEATV
ncbi:MAG: allophanate hydrolase [Acidobacteria bacterium]|nr:MAG: allophanate hydrolase [Acidobacteriota bacterium]